MINSLSHWKSVQHIQVTDNVEDSWASFCDTIHATAYKTLGPTKRKHQDWFDKNKAYLSDQSQAKQGAFSNIRSTVQSKLREMQDTWLSQKWEEI